MPKSSQTDFNFPVRKKASVFGLHLMLDAYDADPEKLTDMKLIFRFLEELPGLIKMKKLTAPLVIDCDATDSGKDPGGISGVVIIAESHISIHTFAEKRFLTLDVYSCNNFSSEIETLLAKVKETFDYQDHELQMVTRGTSYSME